ncbi:MAG: Peptidyl-prolyl cis-trans isomerase [Candidatus Magasanikbacteria bacterium GW2011_GWC2_37_14]|uniref:Peptidyl-prolyl cis-trans isomerase n=1 Tax=Candidatus Magasanikbacteria bacterium GW2011_GWC2_37_14 TaxID=1619046 RepID=A0A0G0GPW0_9BACT|nr:MAG: Peptidyl-prolyl cis-trans isomerase [Candidatus Magasanikbacteria bacterium GW2011_GWC2_37_14]
MKKEKIADFHPEKHSVLSSGKKYKAKIKTSKGEILAELNHEAVPVTVNNFVYLASTDFYNQVIFHRVIDGFMIQGGDPSGTGAGGPGYKFKDEKFSGTYERGVLAMANAGAHTNGSQFFIMHADVPLPPNYTIFGKVVNGLEIVDVIATSPVTYSLMGEASTPVEPVIINEVEIIEE